MDLKDYVIIFVTFIVLAISVLGSSVIVYSKRISDAPTSELCIDYTLDDYTIEAIIDETTVCARNIYDGEPYLLTIGESYTSAPIIDRIVDVYNKNPLKRHSKYLYISNTEAISDRKDVAS